MTKEARRRKRRIRKIKRAAAWAVLIAFELAAAAVPTVIMAAVAFPIAYAERGGAGIGGEWLLVTVVFCWAFGTIHNRICDRIYGEV
ncbi:MAG: hypothetical protein U0I48_03485 [Acutalibacteraceae bacterium]|nr:hypothetical protein [Acutalibacteraceae bacterium]